MSLVSHCLYIYLCIATQLTLKATIYFYLFIVSHLFIISHGGYMGQSFSHGDARLAMV